MSWMREARQLAAQCWCDPETSDRVMDPELAEAVARRIACWIETAARYARNEVFYRDLLDKCAEHLGVEAYTANDGTVFDQPIRLRIPELVRKLKLSRRLE